MFPTDVVIVAGARTPMARYTGSFSDVSAIDLGAHRFKGRDSALGSGSRRFRSRHLRECAADQRRCDLWGEACGSESGTENGDAGGDGKSLVRHRH